MITATVTSKGQVTIPKEIRDACSIREGTTLQFELGPDHTIVVRPRTRSLLDMMPLLKSDKHVTVEEMNEAIRRHVARVASMIAIDTNVVVRFLVHDDAAQVDAVGRLVRRARGEGAKLLVSDVVLAETVWVLGDVYGFDRRDIRGALLDLLSAEELQFENALEVERALEAFGRGGADFADYLIRERGLTAGARALATFDAALRSEPDCIHPDPDTWSDGMSVRETAPAWGSRPRRRVKRA